LVIDQETNECKGTAFVKFYDSAPAQRLIQYSRDFELSQLPGSKINFKEDIEINLDLNGRMIKIFPAESRSNLADRLENRDNKD
jgi:RNA recognition motif-containing protein